MLMPKKQTLIKILEADHSKVLQLFSDIFLLNEPTPVPIRISNDQSSLGLFDCTFPIIYINPEHKLDFGIPLGIRELRLTVAHETGHYLHFLKIPEFYCLCDHPKMPSKEADHSERMDFLRPITQFREVVANIVSFEFFRLNGLLDSYIDSVKRDVLDNLKDIDKHGCFRRAPFDTLVNYSLYAEFFNRGSLRRITTASHLDLELFRDIESKYNGAREYLVHNPEKINKVNVVQGPSGPKLFD